ncbi:major facilitator superfamily protein [Actinidia rufa]|uniref:Major facilitator superfamily protein n=1 Tax=Actinidia rufa TaxID=165716 RepID=A0A7J0EFT6_9ERIC|nr:major facilitator superfamily protein [Actinidia rufa]
MTMEKEQHPPTPTLSSKVNGGTTASTPTSASRLPFGRSSVVSWATSAPTSPSSSPSISEYRSGFCSSEGISRRVSCASTVEGSERLGPGVSPSKSQIPRIVVWSLSLKVNGGATASQFGYCGGGDSCGGDLGGGEVGGFGDGYGSGDSCGGDLGGGGGFGDRDGSGNEAEVGGEAVAPPLTFEERGGVGWVGAVLPPWSPEALSLL